MEISRKEKGDSSCYPSVDYSTSHDHRYHKEENVAPNKACPAFTAVKEAAALAAAWDRFNTLAAALCANNGKCAGEKVCTDTITGRSATRGPLSRKFTPSPNDQNIGTLECFVTINMNAKIACNCA